MRMVKLPTKSDEKTRRKTAVVPLDFHKYEEDHTILSKTVIKTI